MQLGLKNEEIFKLTEKINCLDKEIDNFENDKIEM